MYSFRLIVMSIRCNYLGIYIQMV